MSVPPYSWKNSYHFGGPEDLLLDRLVRSRQKGLPFTEEDGKRLDAIVNRLEPAERQLFHETFLAPPVGTHPVAQKRAAREKKARIAELILDVDRFEQPSGEPAETTLQRRTFQPNEALRWFNVRMDPSRIEDFHLPKGVPAELIRDYAAAIAETTRAHLAAQGHLPAALGEVLPPLLESLVPQPRHEPSDAAAHALGSLWVVNKLLDVVAADTPYRHAKLVLERVAVDVTAQATSIVFDRKPRQTWDVGAPAIIEAFTRLMTRSAEELRRL